MMATDPACSFCGATQRTALRRMVAGPTGHICEVCVCSLRRPGAPEAPRAVACCSFCGRARPETARLVSSTRGVGICPGCLRLAEEAFRGS